MARVVLEFVRVAPNCREKLVVYRMDFEAIPLYNKIILGSATPEQVRNLMNKHVL